MPRNANMPTTVITEFTEKARLRNRSRRRIGAGERLSTAMNAARKTAAMTKQEITSPLVHPAVDALITAYSRANTAMAIVICPGQSSERPSGAEEFCAVNAAAVLISARTPTVTNAQRHDAYGSEPQLILVTRPPRTGEMKPPDDSAP